jgi:hypothetical protein
MSDAGLQSKQKGSNPRKVVVSFWSRKLWDAWVADVKLGLEMTSMSLKECGGGENSRWEEKLKFKDRLLQAQARAALKGLLPIVSLCDAKCAAYAVSLCRTAQVYEKQLLAHSQYNVLQLCIYNHTERAPRIADFGRRLTGLLRNWMAIGMDLGFAIIHMQLLMLIPYMELLNKTFPMFHYFMPLFTAQ